MALDDLRASGKDVPFILVSGTLGDAEAVRAMKAGAQDYVLKGELTRLPMAVEREVRDAAMRAEQTRMSEHLVISERMASAGMLAAGVAHEINNPLAIAMTNLEFIADMVARAASAGTTAATRLRRSSSSRAHRFVRAPRGTLDRLGERGGRSASSS